MTKNRLGSVCGALPWKLDIRSATLAVICNAQNLSTGIVLECTGTPTQKAAMNYIIQCANLMPEAVEVIRDLIGIAAVLDYGADNAVTRAKQLLAKLEGGADNAQNP